MNRCKAWPARIILLCMTSLLPTVMGSSAQAQSVGSRIGTDIHEQLGANLDKVLDMVQASGMKWVRADFNWINLNNQNGVFNWTAPDQMISKATARGIKVYPTLFGTPQWATDDAMWNGVPRNVSDWTNFVTAAVNRYPQVTTWGIWNEPNLSQFWSGTRQQYIDNILKPASDAIHAANPNAKAVGPELAHLVSADWDDWLSDVLDQASDKIDILTHHSYGTNTKINQNLEGYNIIFFHQDGLKDVLQEKNWNKPVWLTETGWMSDDYGLQGQADNYTTMLNQWMTNDPNRNWLDKIFFFDMQPSPPGDGYSILDGDMNGKPAYFALKDFISAHTVPEPATGMLTLLFAGGYFVAMGGRTSGRRITTRAAFSDRA